MTVTVPTAVRLHMVVRHWYRRTFNASRHTTFWKLAFVACPQVTPPLTLDELLAITCRIFLDVLAYTTGIAFDHFTNGAVFSDEAASAFGVSFVLFGMCQMLFKEVCIIPFLLLCIR